MSGVAYWLKGLLLFVVGVVPAYAVGFVAYGQTHTLWVALPVVWMTMEVLSRPLIRAIAVCRPDWVDPFVVE